jgi:hypothetical protein
MPGIVLDDLLADRKGRIGHDRGEMDKGEAEGWR